MDFQLKIGPTTQDARIQRAGALCKNGEDLIRAGDFDGALQAFSQAADIFPEYARAKNALAVISVHKGDWNKAAGYFSEAFNLVPDDPVITLNAGRFLERLSKPEEAIKVYQSYLERKHDQNISQELARLKTGFLPDPKPSIQRNEKQIVFISDMSPFIPRVPKFAYGLKQNGWDVVLLHRDALNFDPKKYFVETRQYRNPDEAAELATAYRPLAYHVFSSWYFNTAAAVIRRRPGKVVFDDYDVMAGMVKEDFVRRQYPGQLELERFCLENADGLCCRSLETQYAKQYLGYHYQGKRILLLDCCWGNNATDISELNQKNDEFHIAYCGNMDFSDTDGKKYNFLGLAKALANQNVHLHIYPAHIAWSVGSSKEGFSEYMKLADTTPFFHLHRPVAPDNLINELSQYDAGLFDARLFGNAYNVYTHRKFIYAPTNKLFDYIDADLPVIINATKFQEFLLRHMGVAVKVDCELRDSALHYLQTIDWAFLYENVMKARSQYAVANQSHRLIEFYNSI